MVEKCDGCEFEDIVYTLINGQEKNGYCIDCIAEAIWDLVSSNTKISFEVKDKEIIVS